MTASSTRTNSLSQDEIWQQIDRNAQAVAVAHELIQPDETFTLTEDQRTAIDAIAGGLAGGVFEHLLKAPTGSGKTEVLLRVGVRVVLDTSGYVVIIAPTRDLVRQHFQYFSDRLEGTGLGVVQVHGGVAPADRARLAEELAGGKVHFVVGSAMMLSKRALWEIVDRSALLVVDDVNAFDEREHLRLLEDLDCPLIFSTATPEELRPFLTRIGAFNHLVAMRKMPFDVIPTREHRVEGVWGEPPAEQLARADALIREHLERKSRIFVIGRTRDDVPRLAERLETTYGVAVQQLRGDMADTGEHRKRHRRSGVRSYVGGTRVEMMRDFRAQAPAILAATNLVGSGLDIPAADLIVLTDADAFGEGEVEQLIGRVGRRERPSDAVLIVGTTFERNPSRAVSSGPRRTFMPAGMRKSQLRFNR